MIVHGPAHEVAGPGTRDRVNAFLADNHYLGPLPVWKSAAAAHAWGESYAWQGVIVLGSPCSRKYGREYLEVRRIAVAPDAPPETAQALLKWAQAYASSHLYKHLLAYADPNASGPRNCPGNADGGRLWTDLGFQLDGQTRPRKSTEKGSSRRVMDGSRTRFVWHSPLVLYMDNRVYGHLPIVPPSPPAIYPEMLL